jgi:S1-C subfamily serine protease
MLGACYANGDNLAKNEVEAVKWFRKAAEQNFASAQFNLGVCCANGQGVAKDNLEAYKWEFLAAAQGDKDAKTFITLLENKMSRDQIAESKKLARNFKPGEATSTGSGASGTGCAKTNPDSKPGETTSAGSGASGTGSAKTNPDFKPGETTSAGSGGSSTGSARTYPESSNTGFFITNDGYLIASQHGAGNGAQVRLVTAAGLISAKVVKVDAADDLALLKAEGKFSALPVAASRAVELGGTVVTVGFPNIGLQGFAPKLAKGEIASLSGAGDDARYFQISVSVQPGNSGGALLDERGNVVGVVSAKLSVRAAPATSGALPENVNYALKSSYLLSFLESVPEVSAKLKEPETKEQKFEEVVKSAEQAAVLVLVY